MVTLWFEVNLEQCAIPILTTRKTVTQPALRSKIYLVLDSGEAKGSEQVKHRASCPLCVV